MKMIRASRYCSSFSDHTYQSRLAEFGSERDSWNHGWSLEVWFITRSAITRIRRACAASISSSTSSTVP